jgi:hypothetical protein
MDRFISFDQIGLRAIKRLRRSAAAVNNIVRPSRRYPATNADNSGLASRYR